MDKFVVITEHLLQEGNDFACHIAKFCGQQSRAEAVVVARGIEGLPDRTDGSVSKGVLPMGNQNTRAS